MFYKILNVVRMHLALTFRTMFSRPADPNLVKIVQNLGPARIRAREDSDRSERPRPDRARSDRNCLHVIHPPRASLTFAEPPESRIPSQHPTIRRSAARRRGGRSVCCGEV